MTQQNNVPLGSQLVAINSSYTKKCKDYAFLLYIDLYNTFNAYAYILVRENGISPYPFNVLEKHFIKGEFRNLNFTTYLSNLLHKGRDMKVCENSITLF